MTRLSSTLRTAAAVVLTPMIVATTISASATSAGADNISTPRNLTGYGFDQCEAPTQSKMDTWMNTSPFLAAGIYISGDSRGCRTQANLSPAWVRHQLNRGWRLLPITMGPQASCSTHFPRYGNDETINPDSSNVYARARSQGKAEATKTVNAAQNLGISKNSILWYDLEGFDSTGTRCRESAIRFVSAWVTQIRSLGYRTGLYSSAGSGIKMFDDARIAGRKLSYPEYLWIARWDGNANTSTTYISDKGWNPHRRVKQYQGGHNETWGGVTINIDRNWLDVGRGTVAPPAESHCGGVNINFWRYNTLTRNEAWPSKVKALQCLLKEQGLYGGKINGRYNDATIKASNAWKARIGAPAGSRWNSYHWVTLLSAGPTRVVKFGSGQTAVRRIQRALNASIGEANLEVTGVFNRRTDTFLRRWQKASGLPQSGVASPKTWAELKD